MLLFKKKTFRIGFLALLLCLPLGAMAQNGYEKLSQKLQTQLLTTETQETVTVFIYFKDKGKKIEEKLQAAKDSLSPRALQRRTINRGVDNVVDFTDIPINPEYIELIKTEVTKVRHQLKSLNAVSVEATQGALNNISKFNFVKKIKLVNKVKRSPEPEPSPALPKETSENVLMQAESTFALDYGGSYTQNNQIKVPEVHDLGYSGSGVIVAIFDSGFNRLSHEAFSQMDIADTWDFVNGDSDVGDGSDMGTGSHGTNTLSTVGGYSPGDLIGPAYGATYYLAKTENSESELHVEEDNWCAAAEWADTNGAQIITSSLGYRDFDTGGDYSADDMDGDSAVITQCADLAASKGIIVINSAGNEGNNSSENTLGAPSDGNDVLAIGAVTSSGTRSSFSSVGPSADGRIKPDVMAMGSSVRVASSSSNTGYSSVNGTSFSCPLTAGVAALTLESNPSLTVAQFGDILRNTADNASSPNNLYGYGIINALAAVDAAAGESLKANFTYVVDLLDVDFTDTSSAPSSVTITDWNWDFGDGNSSTVQNPTYTYGAAGTYSVTLIVTDSQGNTDSKAESIVIDDSLEYCDSQAGNQNYEWISQVDVGAFSNASEASGYTDFTSELINVTPGLNYAVTLTPGYANSSYREYWKIWIDFNKNGKFTDAGEEVFYQVGTNDVAGTIEIPKSANPGNTRMRVSMDYSSNPDSCGSLTYGEVEDYTIVISE